MFLDHKQLIRPADIAGHFGDVADIHIILKQIFHSQGHGGGNQKMEGKTQRT